MNCCGLSLCINARIAQLKRQHQISLYKERSYACNHDKATENTCRLRHRMCVCVCAEAKTYGCVCSCSLTREHVGSAKQHWNNHTALKEKHTVTLHHPAEFNISIELCKANREKGRRTKRGNLPRNAVLSKSAQHLSYITVETEYTAMFSQRSLWQTLWRIN